MDRALQTGINGTTGGLLRYRKLDTPTEENRWVGLNRGAYSHPEYESLAAAYDVAIDPAEITHLTIQLEKFIRTELPTIYLYLDASPNAFVAGLKGPVNKWNEKAGAIGRNIHEWYWDL
jgi:ABC-type transport system substrate-binding protein